MLCPIYTGACIGDEQMAERAKPDPNAAKTFWQPLEERAGISDEGRKWLEENAEAIKSLNEWVAKNGLPLAKYRPS
jgi:post-segregation antitoxin (ccd killing protein)